MNDASLSDMVFDVIKRRRVTRAFLPQPVDDALLAQLVAAARWASNASNRHIHKFLITRDPRRISLVRAFAPGLLAEPPALIFILTDEVAWARERLQPGDDANAIDVGTAAQNMMVMAQALGLGTCPVTSFSKIGVATVLELPEGLVPELMLMVGHPQPVDRGLRTNAPKPLRVRDLTYWEVPGVHDPA
ncbi:MAG: nitroreductase family protein [Thermomicrobiales bacterium]|nr:nitroreductase family protein [Thermomicrobiales bacterium]